MATPPTAAMRAESARRLSLSEIDALPDVPPPKKRLTMEEIDALPEPTGGPATLLQQSAIGTGPVTPPPTQPELTRWQVNVFDEVKTAERRSGRPQDAEAEAWAAVTGIRRQVPQGDQTQLLPAGALGKMAQEATEPGTMGRRAAEAFSPRWFSEADSGVQHTAGWRVAVGQEERERAANLRAARDISFGVPADAAKKEALRRLNAGEALVLPTPLNKGTATAQTDLAFDKIAVPDTAGQALGDIHRGVVAFGTSLDNTAKDVLDAQLYVGESGAKMYAAAGVPLAGDWAALLHQARNWQIPDPIDALVKWGDSTPGSEAIPGLGHLIAAYRDTAAREGGTATGVVSLAGLDPNADGTLNAIARVVAARPKRPEGTEPVNAEEVLRATADTSKTFAKDWYKAADTGVDALTGDASAADVGAASARALASGFNAVKTPVMTGFEALSYTPEMRETSLGYYMRVGGSALAAMITTPLARITDAALVSMGAESFRRHRTPTDDKSWSAVFNPGEFTTDYLTAIYNGDSITSETMRVLDTLAKGTDWFSPEWTASMQPALFPGGPGGTTWDIVTGIAAGADLLLPVDGLPVATVRAPVSRGMRFYDGFAEGRALRMAPAEAATMGAARAFPGATDRALAGDALYEEGRQKMSGEADRPAPPVAAPTRDRDASTVVGAATYAWTRRQLDRGIDPREALRATGNVGHRAIADALDEVFTVLGTVEDKPAPAAPPAGPAPAPPAGPVPASPLPSAPPRAAPAPGAASPPPPGPSVIVSTAAPTTGPLLPARQHLLDFATAAHAVASHDHPAPLTKWSPETDAEPDVARRRGRQLEELAAHLHATPDAARGLLQAAAAYTDPRSGRFVTIPWPSPAGLERITDNHIDIALNRLRKASPEQVWRNAIAYENGAHPFWTDEVSPARQRTYMALTAAVRETALSSEDVRTYMALGDRMAAALVRNGVHDTIDAFWAAKEYTTAKSADKRVGGWIQFRKDAAALIHLAETADLSTLLHEDAHLLRSIIPAEQMADIDAYVKQRWGGWSKDAEEWFAEQMESVWAKGELDVPLAEQARNPTLYDRIKRALSTAAGVLTELLRGRVVEDIHPTVDAWMKSWLHLTVEDDPIVVRKKSGERRGPPGWDEARAVSIETRVAEAAALPEGKPRRSAIHKIINDFAYWSGMGKEAAKALRDANKEGNDLTVAQDMAKRARAGVKGAPAVAPAPVAPAATPPAPAPPAKVAAAAPPPPPVAPPVAAPAMAQPARATALSADVLRRVDEAAAGSENASRGVTRRRVLKVLDELVKDGAVVTEADRADLDTDIKAAYRKHPPGKDTTQDAPRAALVKKAVDRVLRRLAPPEAPPRTEPSAPPAVLDDIQAPVEPYEPAAAAPPKSEDLPIGGAGNAWTTYRGQPRTLYDRNGRGYKVMVMLSPLDSLLASHDINGTPTKGYNQGLQNRLNADQRADVLIEHALRFVPDLSLTIDTPTPTVGTMTTWRETPDGPLLTAAGNGRLNTVRYIRDAALRGEPWAIPAYASIQAHVDLTARALGLGNAEPGDIVHFHLADADEKAALEFAENSQDTPTEEMVDAAIISGHAETIRRSDARVVLEVDKLPPELNEATVAAYVAVDPIGFDKAIAALVPSAAEREGLVNTPTKFLQAVKGVLLGQIDRATQKAIAGHGKAALDRLITATPAILALDAIVGADPAMTTFRVGDYYRDAEELVRYGRSKKAVTPKALSLTALNLATTRTLTAATPLPVSKVSFALACAILQKETPGGVFQVLRELYKEAAEFKKPKMFGAPDPVAAVVDTLTAGTKNATLVPAELPGTHAEAVTNAEGLAYQSLAAKVGRGEPVPTEPPGYVDVLKAPEPAVATVDVRTPRARKPRVHFDYTEDPSKPSGVEHPAGVSDPTGKDSAAFGGAAYARDAVRWIAQNSADPAMRNMAQKIVGIIPEGVPLKIVQPGVAYKGTPSNMDMARGVYKWDKENTKNPGAIWILGSVFNGDLGGIREDTLLHEALHSAVNRRIQEGSLKNAPNGPAKKGAAQLRKLSEDLVKWHSDQHFAGTLPDFASGNRFRAAINDPAELITYGLTSAEHQNAFRQIILPGERVTVWSRFVEGVREILGLTKTDDSALARIIDATNVLLEDALGEDGLPVYQDVLKQERTLQTDTPEFKAWFGGSKVVGEDGRALVVHHGTPASFDTFSKEHAGGLFHFTEDRGSADSYARGSGGGRRAPGISDMVDDFGNRWSSNDAETWSLVHAETKNTKPTLTRNDVEIRMSRGDMHAENPTARTLDVFLRITNPLDVTRAGDGSRVIAGLSANGDRHATELIADAKRAAKDGTALPWDTTQFEFANRTWENVIVPQLKVLGYDGLRMNDHGHMTWTVFDPEQVKSATANRGTFDPTNPNILHQHRAYTAASEATATGGALRTDTTLRDTEPTFAMASVDWRGPDFTEAQARAAAAGAPPVQARILNAWADELGKGREIHAALNRTMPSIEKAENPELHAAAQRLGGTIVGTELVNPYGVIAAGLRAKPLLTREQMNLALGYRADQSTYEGKDLTSRALAWVTVNRLQGQQMPRSFALVGNRVSVPVARAAGVRARGIAILGDLPKAVHAAVHTVTATGTVPGTRGIGAGREVVRLAPVDAARFMVIRDYLTASGWGDSMRLSTQRLTMDDLTTGADPRRVSSQDFTTDAWADLVGAVYDSQSGVAPFRGKADRVNLASQIVWWAAQKRSAYDVLGRDAPLTQRVGYAVRSQLSAAIITGARLLLPGEMWAPDMPEHIRVLFEQFRRQVGRAPGDLAEALEHAVWVARDGGVGRDGELLAAIRGLSSRLDGLDAPISVSQNGRGFSDLDEARGWLHEDPTPNAGAPKVSAPYRPAYDAQGALLPHDAPRTVHPVTDVVAEVTAHAGLVERMLNRGVMDADTIDALAALRSRTLDAQQAAFLYTRVWSMVADAQDLGMSILTAAAGKSGEDTKTRDRIAASRSDGRALDAYQSFFLGIYAHEQTPTVDAAGVAIPHPIDTSIETMVRELGASPVEMTAWVAEALNGLRVRYLTEQFFDQLVDHQYAVDLRMLWRDATPGAPLPDLATRSLFANDVRRAASNILLGQDRRILAGTTAAGVMLSPEPNQTGVTSYARAAAHSMIARMGLRPDMAATRKAMKGQVVPSPIKATFGRMFYDEAGTLRPTPDYTALNTIDAFRPTDTVTTLYGRDLTLSTPLMERVRQLQAEQGPFGTLLANNLRDRGTAERFVENIREYGRQYKGSLITGGPNGITAAAMAGVAFAGGVGSVGIVAALPAAALAGAVTYALTFRPRLAAYATNFVGALFQGYTEYGLKDAMRATFFPGSAKMAIAATRHSIHLTRMRAPLELAWRMVQALGDRAAGGVDHTSFVDPLGRVWTVDSVVRFGEANGLDGNMAKHESAERAQQTIDRIARTYGPQTPMGRIYNAVASFYGRHAIAENYRKVYEASDTYFRYAFLTRGLMDGANPHEAMDRARAAFFDYSDSAPIDRAFNSFFLFWMFNRRTVDLTLRTLLTEPHRVLGPLRFLNAQALRSGYEDTDADHNLAMETQPDYAIGRVAIGWLPVSSTNVNGVKIMLQEPIPVNALRTLNDIGNVDAPAILGRMNPQVQSGLNVVLGSMGAPAVSFFRKRPVESDAYWDVPMWFVKNDQDAFGGQFAEVFKWYVEPTNDPSRWIAPEYPFVYRIPAQNRTKWDVFRSLSGMSTMFNAGETDDRTGGYTQHIGSTVADFIAGMDPMNAMNLRQSPMDILKQGGTVVPAVDASAREFVGRDVESLRNLGISTALVRSRNGALDAMKAQVLDAAKGRLKAAKQAEWKGQPMGTVDGAPVVAPDAPFGVTPAAPIGIQK